MTPHWICQCGQRLRGRPHSNLNRVFCPSCGELMRPLQASGTESPKPVSSSDADIDRIDVYCECGAHFLAKIKLAGREISCPDCQRLLVVPGSEPSPRDSAVKSRTHTSAAKPAATAPRDSAHGNMKPQSKPNRQPVRPQPAPTKPVPAPAPLAPLDELLPSDELSAPAVDPLGLGGSPQLRRPRRSYFANDQEKLIVLFAGGGLAVVLLLFCVVVIQSLWTSAPPSTTSRPVAQLEPTPLMPAPTKSRAAAPPSPRPFVGPMPAAPVGNGGAGAVDSSGNANATNVASGNRHALPEDSQGSAANPFRAATASDTPAAASGHETSFGIVAGKWLHDPLRSMPKPLSDPKKQAVLLQYSWMTQLLPQLGHEKLYASINFKKSWTDDLNAALVTTVIPDFLDPRDARTSWQGYPFDKLGLTHFVGVSGIDQRNVAAASLPRSDPNAGVFGYQEVARPEDMTDGTSNTIMVAGAGELVGPWAANGGSTVRGAREPFFDPLTGFGSKSDPSGTMVLMADGSTRFIKRDIDPQVFHALCTIHGGDSADEKQLGAIRAHFPTKRSP